MSSVARTTSVALLPPIPSNAINKQALCYSISNLSLSVLQAFFSTENFNYINMLNSNQL